MLNDFTDLGKNCAIMRYPREISIIMWVKLTN